MTVSLDPRPSATTFDVARLVDLAWQGRIRVPHFQRDFRWTRQDVIRLFDSIVRGYPVGSLLLWVRPAKRERIRLGVLEVDAPETDTALWVVDGQQRITSLANALHPTSANDPRFAIAYDLNHDTFIALSNQDTPTQIPLPVLFDLPKLIQWFADNPELATSLARASAVTTAIRQFQIPAYQVEEADVTVLQDIFDRMNNYGKRLSRAEVFSALFAGDESAKDSSLTIGRIAEEIDAASGFGHIDDDTVLRALLARRGADVSREIRTEFADEQGSASDFAGEDREAAFVNGKEALGRAVRFLQEEAGVPHLTFLPYRYLLTVLTRLFGHHPNPSKRHLQLIRRWYWRAAVTGPEPFKGNFSTAMGALCARVTPDDLTTSIQALLDAMPQAQGALPDLDRFRTNEATSKVVLGTWWHYAPRSLTDGEPFAISHLAESLLGRSTARDVVHHVIPQRSAPAPYRRWAANRVLLPTENLSIGEIDHLLTTRPSTVDESTWERALRSHGVTLDAAAMLASGDVDAFWRKRQETLRADMRRFLGTACEWGFEDTPPLDEFVLEDLDDGDD